MSSITVKLREAQFSNLMPQALIALFGKRRTGKTQFAMYLTMYIARNVGRFVCMCGNKDNMVEWTNVLPKLFIHPKSTEKLEEIVHYYDLKVSAARKAFVEAGNNVDDFVIPKELRVLVIIDDCGNDRHFMHSKIMKDLCSNGRHYGFDILILAQYINQLASENRDQMDYVGILHTSNSKNIEKIYNEYISEYICSRKSWNYLLGACTGARGSMCWIDNADLKNVTLNTRVFHKVLPWPPRWRIVGSEKLRDYGDRHYMEKAEANGDTSPSSRFRTIQKIQQRRYTFQDKKGPVYNIFKLKNAPSAMSTMSTISSMSQPYRTHYEPEFESRHRSSKYHLD